MSRIGRKPIPIPPGVKIEVRPGSVHVKGSQGELTQAFPPGVHAEIKDGAIHVTRASEQTRDRAFHGLGRTLIANAVQGVGQKYEKKLEIVGIGYRAALGNGVVTFNLGYSHPIEYKIPPGIEILVEKQVSVTVRGIDKQLVGQVSAEIRDLHRPDVYKGKGVRYAGERLRQKVGKTGA